MKISVLVVSKILRPFVNTLIPNDKYCLDNKQILKKPIQMQLSKKLSIFPPLFKEFLKSTLNFDHLEKKMSLVGYVFPKL